MLRKMVGWSSRYLLSAGRMMVFSWIFEDLLFYISSDWRFLLCLPESTYVEDSSGCQCEKARKIWSWLLYVHREDVVCQSAY